MEGGDSLQAEAAAATDPPQDPKDTSSIHKELLKEDREQDPAKKMKAVEDEIHHSNLRQREEEVVVVDTDAVAMASDADRNIRNVTETEDTATKTVEEAQPKKVEVKEKLHQQEANQPPNTDTKGVVVDEKTLSRNETVTEVQSDTKESHTGEEENEIEESATDEESNEEEEEEEEENPNDYYFYAFDDKSPVIETPRYAGDPEGYAAFLSNPEPGEIRIVEFYAHWCPHCESFRPKYNKFAERMLEIAEQSGLKLKVYAVSCVPHIRICQKNDVHNYPRVKLFLEGSTEGIELPQKKLHPFDVLKRLGGTDVAMPEGGWKEDEDDNTHEVHDLHIPDSAKALMASAEGSFWFPRSKKEIYNDAYLSFDFAMRNAVFAQKDPLSEDAQEAFWNFIGMLSEVLPPTWRLQRMISEIVEKEETVLEKEEEFFKILDKYPPKKKKWSPSCTRGKGNMGFTCGLWQLFHIMTMGIVEWNLNNVSGKRSSFYTTSDAAESLRQFIEHFFGCEECRINFMHEYDSCSFNRCERLRDKVGRFDDWRELPLWLFEFHNGVNVRLMKERAEAEGRKASLKELKAVEWPSRNHCPSCWYADGRFDPDRVYMFLELIYWPDELISNSRMAELVKSTNHRGEIPATGAMADIDPILLERGVESWVYSLAGLVVLTMILSVASTAQKRENIKRTGKHKKEDDEETNC